MEFRQKFKFDGTSKITTKKDFSDQKHHTNAKTIVFVLESFRTSFQKIFSFP